MSDGHGSRFALIVVLFILLIIVGASFMRGYY
ncbi:YjcZ family sporulation protein [Neobacillus pocheonensis]